MSMTANLSETELELIIFDCGEIVSSVIRLMDNMKGKVQKLDF